MNMDKREIKPVSRLDAKVVMPGSKSFTNRALLVAALADGHSELSNVLKSDDTIYLAEAIRSLGVGIDETDDTWRIDGGLAKMQAPAEPLYLGHSGTGARLIAGLASLVPGTITIDGSPRLRERPFAPLIAGLRSLGVTVDSEQQTDGLPIRITGGTLAGGQCKMPGDVSSQFFTSILLVAPYAASDVLIEVIGKQTSKPYIDITLDIMRQFGVEVENRNYQHYFVKGGQAYQPCQYLIEGDASSASYFMVIAAITQSKIEVKNINPFSAQGDIRFCDVLERMGCQVEKGINSITIQGPQQLQAIDVDMNSMPDTVQTLAVVAALAAGTTRISNIANLRIKETDRLAAVCTELRKAGVEVVEHEDGLEIIGGQLHGAEIETYDDHRMAMAFAALGCHVPEIVVREPDIVSKSFPSFWQLLSGL